MHLRVVARQCLLCQPLLGSEVNKTKRETEQKQAEVRRVLVEIPWHAEKIHEPYRTTYSKLKLDKM